MNNRGSALISAVVASVIAGVAFLAYAQQMNASVQTTAALSEKLVAEFHVSELLEVYRGLSTEQLKDYLEQIVAVPVPCPRIPGDIDGDGGITTADRNLCMQHMGQPPPDGADGNGNGMVDGSDCILIQQLQGTNSLCGSVYCALIPGDYNRDGRVKTNDELVWLNQSGTSGANLTADGNNDGIVNIADKNIINANLNRWSECGKPVGNPPMVAGIGASYRLCEKINATPLPGQRVMFHDYVALLPETSGLEKAKRTYSVQLVNLKNMQTLHCGDEVMSVTPSGEEAFLVTVEIAYGEKGKVYFATAVPNL